MRASKYTRDVLEPVVARSDSVSDVIRAFGLKATGGNHRYFTAVIFKAGLDTSHFGRGQIAKRIRDLSHADLADVIRSSLSVAQVLAHFGLPQQGRPQHDLNRRIRELALDVSHFRGAGWARGESKETHASLARGARLRSLPDDQVFILGSLITGNKLMTRLVRLGWSYACSVCGIAQWQGRALTLHVDHTNGKHYDNRLENLRILCPNCHAQTPTYGNRARRAREACYTKRRIASVAELVDAPRLGRGEGYLLGVRVPPLALTKVTGPPRRCATARCATEWRGDASPPLAR